MAAPSSRSVGMLVATLLLICGPSAHALDAGDTAPRFSAPSLDRASVVDLDDFSGKVVLLDFWASWCAPCLKSLPKLEELRREFSGSDFRVVAVNLDEEPESALRFLSKNPVGYPSATDPAGRIPERFELGTMPTSYLIDREGVIRYVHEGFQRGDERALRDRIRSLLVQGR
jgi:thiol-disulfide isomerase/thioredoxin